MTKGVHDTLVAILSKHGNMTLQDVEKMLEQWRKERRYLWDIWI
jgi:sulfite reductase alpha subunit-like flavoprotein